MEGLAKAAGHADRATPLKSYCAGLLLPGERKSVEPMAARLAPDKVRQMHQSLHHLVADAPWEDEAVLRQVRAYALTAMREQAPIQFWIIDDTGFPKKGQHSVGVARQYCGQLGKQDNCRVAVSLSVSNAHSSLPIAWQLYLPEAWANDAKRRKKAGIPKQIQFQTKPAMALQQIRKAVEEEVPQAPVLADAAYGNDSQFREGITELGLSYAVGVQSTTTVWKPGQGPLPKKQWKGTGRPPRLLQRNEKHSPQPVQTVALSIPATAWKTRQPPKTTIPVCRAPSSSGPPGLLESSTPSRGVAAHRMAQGRERTNQVLVLHLAAGNQTERSGAYCQASLDRRTRLPRTQAGTGVRAF